jgi:hypothetical protein
MPLLLAPLPQGPALLQHLTLVLLRLQVTYPGPHRYLQTLLVVLPHLLRRHQHQLLLAPALRQAPPRQRAEHHRCRLQRLEPLPRQLLCWAAPGHLLLLDQRQQPAAAQAAVIAAAASEAALHQMLHPRPLQLRV